MSVKRLTSTGSSRATRKESGQSHSQAGRKAPRGTAGASMPKAKAPAARTMPKAKRPGSDEESVPARVAAQQPARLATVQELLQRLEEARDAVLSSTLESFNRAHDVLEDADQELRTLGLHEQAGAAFVQTLHSVLGDRPLSEQAARRAALTAAASTVWEDAIGPLLSGEQARELLGISRQRLSQLAKSGRLILLEERSGDRRYPAWQFGEDGRPLDALVAAFRTLATEGETSSWSAASWATHQHPELDDRSPREWAAAGKETERLLLVASRDAARAAR
jgi:hypothetical protein